MRTVKTFVNAMIALLVLVPGVTALHGKIIYVDDDAPAPGDGSSWTTAYRHLQDALADANDTDEPTEIRIAQGIYKPDEGANQTMGDAGATFNITGGLSLKGGFAGIATPDPDAREVSVFRTILSGDLAGDDPPTDHARALETAEHHFDNSYHVMMIEDPNGTALIDGITIMRGYDDNVYFAPSGGAALYCRHDSQPTIHDCTFKLNAAIGNFGGAIFGGTLNLIDCTFEMNFAGFGGAIANCGGSLRNCRFVDNAARESGGSLYDCIGTAHNSLFIANSADEGGAVFLKREGDLLLSNCTFSENVGSAGRALSCGSYGHDYPVTVNLKNCILWNGGDEIRSSRNSTVQISYSDIQEAQVGIYDPCNNIVWGPGNLDSDPIFTRSGYRDPNRMSDDPNDYLFVDGDYHLKSQAGHWDPSSGTWLSDDISSPCVDAGDPNSDIADEIWPHGGRINMGAYGGTAQASISVAPTEMFLPRIAYVYWWDREKAESFQSFLQAHGCPVTLLRSDQIAAPDLEGCDLIMIDRDTQNPAAWPDQAVSAVTEAGKPILGLGDGGYRFFGRMNLTIGYPNGASSTFDSVQLVDPNDAIIDMPYTVTVPQDGVVTLYDVAERGTVIYLWPAPDTVTKVASIVGDPGYFPLVAEHGHFLWGFTESPEHMTALGQRLFLNAVIRTANGLLEPNAAQTP